MILDIAKQFNWIDIFVIIIALRICYVAVKSGFLAEFFKILGTIFAIYLSLHYFTALSEFIQEHIPQKAIPMEFLDFLSFLELAIVGYLVFAILRQIILRFIKMEAVPKLSRWGGLILGVARIFLLTSLIMFTLVISTITYFSRSVTASYSGKYLFKIAPAVYSSLWNGLVSKFATKERFNQDVLDIQFSDSAHE